MDETGQKVRIINENFRQGYGKEGTIIGMVGHRTLISYEDEGEVYQWTLSDGDFEKIGKNE